MHILAFLRPSNGSVNGIVCIPIVGDFMCCFISLHQMTPLHIAVEGAHTEIVKYLVDREADINIKDYNGVNIYVCMESTYSLAILPIADLFSTVYLGKQ